MNFKKILVSFLLLAGIAMSPYALAEQSFGGHRLNAYSFGIGDSNDAVGEETIDKLYDWAESKYPQFFPTHQESMDIIGYYARFYPESSVYMGYLKGHLYVYGTQFDGLLDLGELGHWVEKMETDQGDMKDSNSQFRIQ